MKSGYLGVLGVALLALFVYSRTGRGVAELIMYVFCRDSGLCL